jgi:hypothetical protein
MPHYYFDIKDGHRLLDPSGLNFNDDDDTFSKAQVIAVAVSLDSRQSIRSGTLLF